MKTHTSTANSKKFSDKRGRGFTLLEMVVSLGIFSAVVVISIGTIISIQSAHRKSQTTQTVQDNLRFALESMTKEIRAGSNFVQNGSVLKFQVGDPLQGPVNYYTYCTSGAAGFILRFVSTTSPLECDPTSKPARITDPTIAVDYLIFRMQGIGANDGQPRITVILRAHSTATEQKTQSVFQLQTTVTAIIRDTS